MPAQIFHADLYGTREYKYQTLLDQDALSLNWAELVSDKEFQLFVPQAGDLRDEYQSWHKISEVMPLNSVNFRTHRDALVIDFDKQVLYGRIEKVGNNSYTDVQISREFGLHDSRDWSLAKARVTLFGDSDWSRKIYLCHYRPFDFRWIFYDASLVEYPCYPVVGQYCRPNIGFSTTRQTTTVGFEHILATKHVIELKCVSHDRGGYSFPLYVYSNDGARSPNFSPSFIEAIQTTTDLTVTASLNTTLGMSTDAALPTSLGMFTEFHGVFNADLAEATVEVSAAPENTVTPEDIFHYAYAIFHSPTYRERYAEFLKIDFPRLPLTSDVPLFRALSALGEQLTALHLMERAGPNPAAFPVPGSSSVDAAPKYDKDDRRVFINKTQYFAPVPPEVWAFQIGGYQVCHKWLKDRKGRTLTEEDITHYGSIVAALGETIRLMAEIDAVIEEHGGWPLN